MTAIPAGYTRYWRMDDADGVPTLQHCNVLLMPHQMELAAFANSRLQAPETDMQQGLIDAFTKSLKPYVLIGTAARLIAMVRGV